MRNLTIKRRKKFTASLAKMRVYIEDLASNEIEIGGVACRKLGDLKNGEEKTFLVDDASLKVFVIADALSKGYCNDFYQLPEGTEDISLTGENKLNPATGNSFVFDNNFTAEVEANRNKSMKKGVIVLAVCFVLGIIIGSIIGPGIARNVIEEFRSSEKIFTSNEFSITLTNEFSEIEFPGITVSYDSKYLAVFVREEKFTSFPAGYENYTIEQYADLVMKANNISGKKIQKEDGLVFFEYDRTPPESNDQYRYFTYLYVEQDAFWIVQFATLSSQAEEHRDDVTKWAKSVEFKN